MGDPRVVAAAVCGAVAAAGAARRVVRPWRRLGWRVHPYAQLSRSRLGTGPADASVLSTSGDPAVGLGILARGGLRRLAAGLGSVVDAADGATLERRLRQAGLVDASPEQYRMHQLAWAGVGLAAGAALGLLVSVSAPTVLVMAALSGYVGASRWRGRVERAIGARREAMRCELYTLAQLLAVYTRTGHGPVEAVREVAGRGRGPVAGELGEALVWVGSGSPPYQAYERLAESTAEPLAARLYRLLGSATASGGDIAQALLALSDDVRAERREELARSAVRRRSAMLVPLLALIAPTMLLFVAAALPHVVFGS